MSAQQGDNIPAPEAAIPAQAAAEQGGGTPPQEPQAEGTPQAGATPQTSEELQIELEAARKQIEDKENWARNLQSERDRLLNHLNQQQLSPEPQPTQAQNEPEMTADEWLKAMSSDDPSEREKAFKGLQQNAKELALQEFEQRTQAQQWEADRQQTLGGLSAEEQYLAEIAINEDMGQGYFTHPADAYLRAKAGGRERLAQLVDLGLQAEQASKGQAVPPPTPQQTQIRPVVPQVPGMAQNFASAQFGNQPAPRPKLNSLWNIRS